MIKTKLLLLFALLCPALVCKASPSDETAVKSAVLRLLDAYSKKDFNAAMALTDHEAVLVMGSDVEEVCDTRAKIEALLHDDFQLWTSASFGEVSLLSVRAEGDLGSAFFDVPFSMQRAPGKTDTMTIRFATVWRRRGGDWKLTQSMNCVPTVGQSAKAIIQKMKGPAGPGGN